MAFTIEMLVKGGFGSTIGSCGYDGEAAKLVHISTDGVAVVPFVHNGMGAGLEVSAQERFCLIEIGDVGGGEDEAEWVAESVAGNMDFGGETGAGAPHRLGRLASGRVGAVGMHTHRRAVDHQVLVVAAPGTQSGQNRGPQPVGSPGPKPVVDTLPRAKALRQITPRCSRAQNPQDRLNAKSRIEAATATPMRPTQAVSMGLNFLSSSHSLSVRTNRRSWFTMRYRRNHNLLSSKRIRLLNILPLKCLYLPDTP